jgi:predicted N-formylglutamate amidohydrolase
MHSFTPVFKGEPRAIEVGILYFRRTRLADILLDLLRGEGDLTVGENAPYALTEDSDFSIPFHGERRGLEHVEVEIRQDLIASPEGQADWARRFARLLTAALPRLS